MTRAYWGFLVHETKFQASIPIMRGIHGIARLCQAGFIPRPSHTPRTLPSHNARAQSRQATEAAGGRSAAHGRNGGRPEKCRTAPGALCRTTPADPLSVARVRPRTSKGITDLLLLCFMRLYAASPSKKKIHSDGIYILIYGSFQTDLTPTASAQGQHRTEHHNATPTTNPSRIGETGVPLHPPRICKRASAATIARHSSAQVRTEERSFSHRTVYLVGQSLVRYRNQPDKSLHQPGTAMHHHPLNQERAINLSILSMSGPGKFPRVESN
jgi:hypothetical protein